MLMTLKGLPLTLFSRDFYSDLIHNGVGIGIGFILVMLVLDLARPMVLSIAGFPETSGYIKTFFHDLPAMTLKKDRLSIDHASPYTITAGPADSGIHILFDMDHDLGSLDDLKKKMVTQKIYVIVTAKAVAFLKDKNGTVQINSYDESHSEFSVTHDDLAAVGKKVAVGFLPFLFVFLVLTLLVGILMKMVFGAVVALIISLMFKVEMGFGTGMRLMAAAAIPGTFLSTAFPFIPGLITLGLWIGYGIFGLWSARQSRPAQT
jgi:hypothetical protein